MKNLVPGPVRLGAIMATLWLLIPSAAYAQQSPSPVEDPGTWTGSAGAGLSLTSGNSDTLNFNIAFDLTRDPKTRNVMKLKALYLRGEQDDATTVNRTSAAFRDQYALTNRAFAFGQLDYLRDTFKLIDYLVAPTAGIGYKVIDTNPTQFAVDGGLGVVWEKNPDVDVSTDVALTAGETLTHKLSSTSSFKHAATALWKADDLADGLYTISVGLAAQLTSSMQLSFDVLDTFKNKPPSAGTKKNDVALVTAIVAKF